MRSLTITRPGEVNFTSCRRPRLGPEEVLLEMRFVGLCGSDLSAFLGLSPLVSYPRVPGHEISAVVVSAGENVPAGVPGPGEAVTVLPYSNCGVCTACIAGRPNACRDNRTLGVQRDGALTGCLAVDYRLVLAAPGLSGRELALVEPLSVGYHAVNRCRVAAGETVLVLGCGAVGLGAVLAAASRGAVVIAADIEDGKLAAAGQMGAAHLLNGSRENLAERVMDLTGHAGARVCLEVAGRPETTRQALELVSFAGRIGCVGYAKGEVPLPTRLLVSREVDLYGCRNALKSDFQAVIEMLSASRVPLDCMISRVVPFSGAASLFMDWAKDRSPVKIMVSFLGS